MFADQHARPALDEIAANRAAHLALGNHQPKAQHRQCAGLRHQIQLKLRQTDPRPLLHQPLKIGGLRETQNGQFLDCQTLATLGAAIANHSAAATGLHANQKAVGALALDDRRLVSAFHDWIPKKEP